MQLPGTVSVLPTPDCFARQASKDASKDISTLCEAALSMLLHHPTLSRPQHSHFGYVKSFRVGLSDVYSTMTKLSPFTGPFTFRPSTFNTKVYPTASPARRKWGLEVEYSGSESWRLIYRGKRIVSLRRPNIIQDCGEDQ